MLAFVKELLLFGDGIACSSWAAVLNFLTHLPTCPFAEFQHDSPAPLDKTKCDCCVSMQWQAKFAAACMQSNLLQGQALASCQP